MRLLLLICLKFIIVLNLSYLTITITTLFNYLILFFFERIKYILARLLIV